VPILIYPVSFMPPGTKAPIVWFGGEGSFEALKQRIKSR
jgi:hypothetical protein